MLCPSPSSVTVSIPVTVPPPSPVIAPPVTNHRDGVVDRRPKDGEGIVVIGAGAAVDRVRPVANRVVDRVVARPAIDRVGPEPAGQRVVAVAAGEHIGIAVAGQDVVALPPVTFSMSAIEVNPVALGVPLRSTVTASDAPVPV